MIIYRNIAAKLYQCLYGKPIPFVQYSLNSFISICTVMYKNRLFCRKHSADIIYAKGFKTKSGV